MRIVSGFVLAALFLLQACSSAPSSTRYYLLNTYQAPESSARTKVDAPQGREVKVAVSVQLPEYLNQPSLVMQIDEHQIHHALFHVWAEPLLLGTTKSLLADLNTQSQSAEFVNTRTASWAKSSSRLDVQVEYFHITNDSRVILSGQYRISDGESRTARSSGPFAFEQNLSADGYEQSIVQMRRLVSELAGELIARLEGA